MQKETRQIINRCRTTIEGKQEVIVKPEKVCWSFKRDNTRKAAGPDRITGRVLKEYGEELSIMLCL